MNTCPYCATPVQPNNRTCPQCGSRLQGWQLAVGTVLDNKYQIQEVLGQGGFGITYLANDPTLQRMVAIKELFPDGSSRALDGSFVPPSSSLDFLETKKRFIDEARVLAQFNHPSIVRIFDVFAANETAYLVMEALDGETLGSRIQRRGVMSEKVVEYIAQELCDALEVVHAGGLLHRDIKPENVFLTNDKRVVLIDFGSARTFKSGQVMQHTQLVTPGYAAPEQYATEAKFGAYTDVYGVAATLYFALTGQAPLSSSDRILTGKEISLPTSISQTLRSAIVAGLEIRIDSRPQSAREFMQRLETTQEIVFGRSKPEPKMEVALPEMVEAHEVVIIQGNPLVTSKQIQKIEGSTGIKCYPLTQIEQIWVTKDAETTSELEGGLESPNLSFWISGFLFVFACLPFLMNGWYLASFLTFCAILLVFGFGMSYKFAIDNNQKYFLLVQFENSSTRMILCSNENKTIVQGFADEIKHYAGIQ